MLGGQDEAWGELGKTASIRKRKRKGCDYTTLTLAVKF